MREALNLAMEAGSQNEVPIGCVIVFKNKIIASRHNRMKELQNQTAHAEILAVADACRELKTGYLYDCDLYVTLEPCNMCAASISFARIRRVYFSAEDQKFGAIYNNSKLFSGKKGLFHIPEVYSGFCEIESEKIIKDFFKDLRNGA